MNFSTSKELAETLKNFKGSSVCSMELTTIVKANKTSRINKSPFLSMFKGDVYRTYKEYGTFGVSYENAVNNQRAREDVSEKFTSNELPWGEWFSENKVIIHKGDFYLRYYVGMNANSNADKDSIYHYEDGTELTATEINNLKDFLPPKSSGSNTQGIEKEVQPRCVKMNGINQIKVGGTVYTRN